MSEKNIYQRINDVMQAVQYVQKDANVNAGSHTYKAVSHDMVVAVVRKEMVKAGIVIRTEQLRSELIQQKVAKGEQGYSMHLYSGDYAVHFVNIDKPDDCFSVTVNAHANDSGDKAPGKAMSYGVKYAILKTFLLETGENEEARFSDPYTPEQLAVYHDLIDRDKDYEFYMFVAALPPETMAGLHNSFPEGKITAGKKKANAMQESGRVKFIETVEEVQRRLANQDISVIEITDEMSAMEKRLLVQRLSDFEIAQLKRIKEAAA